MNYSAILSFIDLLFHMTQLSLFHMTTETIQRAIAQ